MARATTDVVLLGCLGVSDGRMKEESREEEAGIGSKRMNCLKDTPELEVGREKPGGNT